MNGAPGATQQAPAAPLVRLGGTGPRARQPRRIVQRAQRQLRTPETWHRAGKNRAIRTFTANLARYLTDSVPAIDGHRPLLVQCMDEGLEGWRAAHRRAHPARLPLAGYIRGALYPLPQALEWRIGWTRADGRMAVWEPLERPIIGWWKGESPLMAHRRERPADTAHLGLSPADFRLIVLARFLWSRPLVLRSLETHFNDLVCRVG